MFGCKLYTDSLRIFPKACLLEFFLTVLVMLPPVRTVYEPCRYPGRKGLQLCLLAQSPACYLSSRISKSELLLYQNTLILYQNWRAVQSPYIRMRQVGSRLPGGDVVLVLFSTEGKLEDTIKCSLLVGLLVVISPKPPTPYPRLITTETHAYR